MPGHRERDYEHVIRRTLEGVIQLGLHPRTSITVVLQVDQEEGALLSCAINAACAALVDAGVPMTTMFGGCPTVVAHNVCHSVLVQHFGWQMHACKKMFGACPHRRAHDFKPY